MFKNILLAYDGSDHAKRAFNTAVDLALKYGARLEVVEVEAHPVASNWVVEIGQSPVTEMAKPSSLTLAPLCNEARSKGVKEVSGGMLYGEPAHEIANYAKQSGCDLIVMGRRGRGRIEGLLLGSVSSHLTSHADCAVLTVK